MAADAPRVPVWLDVDPGHDDAIALILAAHTPQLHLLGVSVVHGNAPVDKTFANARRVLRACGASDRVPVYKGQAAPLLRTARHDPGIHGDSGLDGTELLPADTGTPPPAQDKAVVAMAAAILASPDKVWVVATAALTNVALMLTLYPEVVTHLAGISLMGGAWGTGNRSPAAEFNILCDPEAAAIVLAHGDRVTVAMAMLELTHTVLVTDEVVARLRCVAPTPFGRMLEELVLFFAAAYKAEFGFLHPPLHDPLAVAFVAAPQLFVGQRVRVEVEHRSTHCDGRTVVDFARQLQDITANATVLMEVDLDGFWDLLFAAVERANCAVAAGPD